MTSPVNWLILSASFYDILVEHSGNTNINEVDNHKAVSCHTSYVQPTPPKHCVGRNLIKQDLLININLIYCHNLAMHKHHSTVRPSLETLRHALQSHVCNQFKTTNIKRTKLNTELVAFKGLHTLHSFILLYMPIFSFQYNFKRSRSYAGRSILLWFPLCVLLCWLYSVPMKTMNFML